MNKKTAKRFIGAVLALTLIGGTGLSEYTGLETGNSTAIVSAATNGVVRGCFNSSGWSGFTTVNSSNTKKSCSIRICTFDGLGYRSGGTVDVEVFDSRGKYIKGFYGSGSSKNFTLPKGYSSYRVRIQCHSFGSGIFNSGKTFKNVGKCIYWSIDGKTNCWV